MTDKTVAPTQEIKMAEETRTVNLYNPHDRLTGRDGGPYLDQEQAREAEKRRAIVEGRDPDFENLPATAGIPLVTAGQLVAAATVHNPSQEHVTDPVGKALDSVVADDNFPTTVMAQAEIPDFSRKPEYNPADPTTVSTDPGDESDNSNKDVVPTEETPDESNSNPEGNGAVVPEGLFPQE